jgi:hypothetical protein
VKAWSYRALELIVKYKSALFMGSLEIITEGTFKKCFLVRVKKNKDC